MGSVTTATHEVEICPPSLTGFDVEKIRQDSLGEHKNTEKALSEIQAELEKLRRGNVNLMREVEDLRKAAHQPPPASP